MIELPWSNIGATTIADRVAGSLARRIAEGEIEPGEVLTEVEVAAEFEASRTPAREAMLKLERWGLVRLAPKKGAVVTNPSARERRELLAVRSMLEASAAASIAADPAARERLATLLDENLRGQGAALADPERFALLDYAFHLEIIGHDDNRVVAEISRSLAPRLYRLTHLAVVNAVDLGRLHAEHVALAGALRDGDAELFRDLMAQHIGAGHAGYEVAE